VNKLPRARRAFENVGLPIEEQVNAVHDTCDIRFENHMGSNETRPPMSRFPFRNFGTRDISSKVKMGAKALPVEENESP
jgi:hypothetical protein